MALPSTPLRGASCGRVAVWVGVWGGTSGMVGTARRGVVSLLALNPCIRGTLTRTVNPDPCAKGRGRSLTAAAVVSSPSSLWRLAGGSDESSDGGG